MRNGAVSMINSSAKGFGSKTEFATFGSGAIAYVRRVKSDDYNVQFPSDEELPNGLDLWGLFGADGNPLSVSDDRFVVFEDAKERNLLAVYRQ